MQPSRDLVSPDSDDDADYIPTRPSSSSSDGKPGKKRARAEGQVELARSSEEDSRKQAREKAWSAFQESLASPSVQLDERHRKLVRVRKTYRFAGEDVTEVIEVPEDSEDAKKWPLCHASENAEESTAVSSAFSTRSGPGGPSVRPADQVTTKAPSRRKSRIQLSNIPSTSSKAKKITTLEKSAIDWRTHVDSQPDSLLRDELDSNRRGGGYLQKVEFLEDVGDRRNQLLEGSRDRKRRRG